MIECPSIEPFNPVTFNSPKYARVLWDGFSNLIWEYFSNKSVEIGTISEHVDIRREYLIRFEHEF